MTVYSSFFLVSGHNSFTSFAPRRLLVPLSTRPGSPAMSFRAALPSLRRGAMSVLVPLLISVLGQWNWPELDSAHSVVRVLSRNPVLPVATWHFYHRPGWRARWSSETLIDLRRETSGKSASTTSSVT